MNNISDIEKANWINFPKKGSAEIGYLGIASKFSSLPFEVRRCFWTRDTPNTIIRGKHAHIQTEMVILALQGEIKVKLEYLDKRKESYILDNPFKGLFIPKLSWHELSYSDAAIQLVLTNSYYTEDDYIRDYDQFKKRQLDYLAIHKESTE